MTLAPSAGLYSSDWYTRFFGRTADRRVGQEILWEIDEHAWLLIEPNRAPAGAPRRRDGFLDLEMKCGAARCLVCRPDGGARRSTAAGEELGFGLPQRRRGRLSV
jgi:hypothetical protein